jgi:hypothetical protein
MKKEVSESSHEWPRPVRMPSATKPSTSCPSFLGSMASKKDLVFMHFLGSYRPVRTRFVCPFSLSSVQISFLFLHEHLSINHGSNDKYNTAKPIDHQIGNPYLQTACTTVHTIRINLPQHTLSHPYLTPRTPISLPKWQSGTPITRA